jgi:cytochrome c biogenesis protein CcdA
VGRGVRVSLLSRSLLLSAGVTSAFYLCGFLFVIIGDPVAGYVAALGLLRSVTMTLWIVWAIISGRDVIVRNIRRQHLEALADDLGIDDTEIETTTERRRPGLIAIN